MISKRDANRNRANVKAGSVAMTDDTGDFRRAMISALGKTQKCQAFSPYGLCSNPPDESMAVLLNMQGIASNTVALIDDPKNRKKNLAKGEVALYNYVTGSFLYLRADGAIVGEITGGSKIEILPDGNTNISATTALSFEAPTINFTGAAEINMTAPTINITGATAVNIISSTIINLTSAILASTGVLTASDFATSIIASLNAHGHAPGTFVDAEARPITGKSGVPS